MKKTKKDAAKILSHAVLNDGSLEILVSAIRPYKNQPRRIFNEEALMDLAASIKIKQRTPIKVRPIVDGQYEYELIDGERRLRACVLCGNTTIRTFVEEVASEEEQFVDSVASNFGREGHTPIETARALHRMKGFFISKNGGEGKVEERLAQICSRSVGWVWQHLGLMRLSEEVQDLMERKEITYMTGVALSNFKPKTQISIARHIIESKFRPAQALRYIRSQRDSENLGEKARMRKPNDDYMIFQSFLRQLEEGLEAVVEMQESKLVSVFRNRPEAHLSVAIEIIGSKIVKLGDLNKTLKRVDKTLQSERSDH